MASVMEKDDSALNSWGPKWERKELKKLRYSGQEYVSKSGKVIPAKKQPELVCTCPQKCGEKIPQSARERLFTEFYRLSDHAMQNRFLQTHIEIRAVQRRFWRQQERTASGRIQRRVSCKYQVPLITSPDDVSDQGEVRPGVKIVEVCQKAFMNIYAITEKRVRIQRERLICHAQETANSPSPGPREDPPMLASPQLRGGDNVFPFGVPRELFAAAAPLSTLSNLSMTPSRLTNDALLSKMFNRNEILATLGDRDVTMLPVHNSSLSIIPVKGVDAHQNSSPAAFPISTAKIPRDVSMIPVNDANDSGEQCMPTDLSMPKAGAVKSPVPDVKIPVETSIEAVSNQPVDLTVKSKPKNESSENLARNEGLKSGIEFSRPSVIYPKEVESKDTEMKRLNEIDIKRFGAELAKLDEARGLPKPLPIPNNCYDLALVTSFFQNQLWQPEFIDIDHLREYQRKLEETSEQPKERKRRPRKAVRITPTEIVQCERVTSMDVSDEVPTNLPNGDLDDKLSPNYVPNNCDDPKDFSESMADAEE